MNSTVAQDYSPATPAQFNLISKLAKERKVDVTARFNRPESTKDASVIIDWLFSVQVPAVELASLPLPAVQGPATTNPVNLATYRQVEGKKPKAIRYALRDEDGTVKFYRVKPGYKPGVFFVDVQASDDYFPIRNYGARTAILARIANDPDAALALYGQELGSCGHCGRTLTSEYRNLGIGPVCINK